MADVFFGEGARLMFKTLGYYSWQITWVKISIKGISRRTIFSFGKPDRFGLVKSITPKRVLEKTVNYIAPATRHSTLT